MKFGILSDIHGYPPLEEDRKELYTCDVVCLCGDVFEGTRLEDFANEQIIDWMKSLTDLGKRVIMTPGNHDIMLYRGWLETNNFPIDNYCRHIWHAYPLTAEELKKTCGCEVLIDESITLGNGTKIYGTPWSPTFCNWAFMKDENDLLEIFSKIPDDTDILLSHTPPGPEWDTNAPKYWFVDVSDYDRSQHLGSNSLTKAVCGRMKNADIFCGHIHSGDHDGCAFYLAGDVKVQNVSYVNENYKPYYKPACFWSVGKLT